MRTEAEKAQKLQKDLDATKKENEMLMKSTQSFFEKQATMAQQLQDAINAKIVLETQLTTMRKVLSPQPSSSPM